MQPAANPLIQVVLVDDDPLFRDAVAHAIDGQAGMTLRDMATNRNEGLQLLEGVGADVLLVDLGLPDGSGIDIIRAAQTQWPHCDVMVATTFGDEAHVLQSIEAGAAGYLLKDSTPG